MANGAQFKPDYYSGKDNASPLYLIDGVNPLLIATVAQFHNSDGQALPSTAYGLLTGGVDQLINASGTLDRKRSAYGDTLPTTGIEASGLMVWNGSSFDRQRGNQDGITLLTSGVVTANSTSADQINYNGHGIKLFITTGTFGSGASTITATIQGKDPVSGTYYTILQSAALSASAFTLLSVFPGLPSTANVSANDVLPRTWRVSWSATSWGTGGSTLGINCTIIL